MQSAPMVESGETSTRWPPIKIDEAIASGLPPPSLATKSRHARQEGRQHHPGRAAVDRDQARHQRDQARDRAMRRKPRQERREQVDSAGLFQEGGQDRHAADHHDHAPGNRQDRRFLIGDSRQA